MRYPVIIYARGHKAPEAEGLDRLIMGRTGQRTIVQFMVNAESWHDAIDEVVARCDGQGIRGLVTASNLRAMIGADVDAPLPELASVRPQRRRGRRTVEVRESRAFESDDSFSEESWNETVAQAMADIEADMT